MDEQIAAALSEGNDSTHLELMRQKQLMETENALAVSERERREMQRAYRDELKKQRELAEAAHDRAVARWRWRRAP